MWHLWSIDSTKKLIWCTHLYYIATRCLRVCLWPISSWTAGPIWLNFYLLAPSWSRDGFRPKKFGIRILWKTGKPRCLGYYLTNLAEIFRNYSTLTQICLNTNKFLDRVSGFPDPESSFYRKIRQKSGLTVYHDVIHHFSYSNHGKFIFGTQFAIWRIFSTFLEDFSR